ncbi:hypothetical protein KC614_01460 [candidate division WWE3 bacterium]|uniref:DNA polymerase III subunit delta n=1 Tax=candidate division WWE3 bacterium TaxID=2053526 RepID=A0A955RQP7_UNCKA|nr:hypothetical protein [candidate division WWE3 bacterium]
MSSSAYIIEDASKTPIAKSHPDVFSLGDENEYGIETVRQLKQWALLKPFQNEHKLVVIKSAEKFTVEAQNALLKLLEEPPDNTYIVLHTGNTSRLLPTLTSRCVKISTAELSNHIWGESISFVAIETIDETLTIVGSVKEALEQAERLAKKYKRSQLNEIIDFWLLESTQNISADTPKIANSLLLAKERLLQNTNVELTLDIMFLDLI